jgi:Ca2+-binding RTX toxin-like protein
VTEDGTTNLVYTFTRTGSTTSALTVNYGITGTAASTDYTGATSGTGKTITFAAGSATATLTIEPTADTTIEADETVALTLAAGTGYTVGTTTAVTGTITNDDVAILSINDITVVEGKDANAFLYVSLSNPSSQPVTVNYTMTPVNATANIDYTSVTGILTIAANTSLGTISIPILNDNLNESDEAFTVTLSNPINGTINPDTAIGKVIITDTWQSTITHTLPAGVENLTLIGTAAINGTGNAGNNVLTGNSGNNTLNGGDGNDNISGGVGADTINGGLGADRFVYSNFNDSLLAAPDRITDFNPGGGDRIALTALPTALFNAGIFSTATTLNAAAIAAYEDANPNLAGTQPLTANQAVFFGWNGSTYLSVNDSIAPFNSSNDLLINVTGITGTIATGLLTTNSFFSL